MKYPCVIRTNHFPPKPFFGISICGFFFFRKDGRLDDYDVRHEHIHFLQQLEWGFVGFFFLYHGEFLLRLWQAWRREPRGTKLGVLCMKAYRAISFEGEAYAHDHEERYLERRRHWANYRKNPENNER